MKQFWIVVLLTFLTAGTIFSASDAMIGTWEGKAIDGSGSEIPFVVKISKVDGQLTGVIDIPAQGVQSLGLKELTVEASTVTWVIPVPDQPINCKMEISGDNATGRWEIFGETGPFSMTRKGE